MHSRNPIKLAEWRHCGPSSESMKCHLEERCGRLQVIDGKSKQTHSLGSPVSVSTCKLCGLFVLAGSSQAWDDDDDDDGQQRRLIFGATQADSLV